MANANFGQTEDFNTQRLIDEVVVVSQPRSISRLQTPFAVTTLNKTQIRERGYRSLPQALRDISGVMVQETAFGQGSPYIRGFTGFRNVFLIDGVRLNNSVFREGPNQYWATVDIAGLDRLEVLKGPASVLYGSDAIGGTVYATTRDIRDTSLQAEYRYASAESANTARLDYAARLSNRQGFAFGVTSKSFGALDIGDEVQHNAGYDEWSADLKWQLDFENWDITALHQHSRQNNVPRTHRTNAILPWRGTSAGSDQKRDLDQERTLSYVKINRYRLDKAWLDGFSLTFSQQTTDEVRDRLRSNGRRELQGLEVTTQGIGLAVNKRSPVGHLTLGLDAYQDQVDSFSSSNPIQGPVGDDATYRSLDLYLHDHLSFGKANLTLGVRHTRPTAKAGRVQNPENGNLMQLSGRWSATTGSLGLQYQFHDQIAVFTGIHQGFRAPNLSDLTRFDSARSNEFEVPAPNLKPEEFVSYEIGLKWEHPRLRAQSAYFYTDIRNMIQRFASGAMRDGEIEITKRNIGTGYVQGVEFDFDWFMSDNLSLSGYAAWMDGQIRDDTQSVAAGTSNREPISRLMPVTLGLTLRYQSPQQPWWLEGQWLNSGAADKLSLRDQRDSSRIPPGGTPAYSVAHLRGGYQVNEHLNLNVSIDNLFDRHYRVHGSGTNMPGRNFILSAQYRW